MQRELILKRIEAVEDIAGMESGGYVYCATCDDWYDDRYCYPEDHGRHCGHALKPPGEAWEAESVMVMTCARKVA